MQNNQKQPNFIVKVLIGYLYFIQGIALSLIGTIPLTYKQIPSYQILGYYSASNLPFSFKFITAPLIQKYSLLSYGRRKFWIVIGMLLASIFLYFVSQIILIQSRENQITTAILLAFVMLSISIQDISLDALSIKQLRKPQLGSLLQSVYQQIGYVIGSLLLGQLTSKRFGQYWGYDQEIITPSNFIKCIIPFLIIPTILIHFKFKQTFAQKQQKINDLSLWQVIKHYKHFIIPKYRVFRQALFFLVIFQGMNFFTAGYSIQLIKANILSKQFILSLGNFSLLLIFPCTYILSQYATLQNLQKIQKIFYILRAILYVFIFFFNSDSPIIAAITLLFMGLVNSLNFYLNGITMNSFQDSKFQGMSVTMMASMSNLGKNSTLQLRLIGNYGFQKCCYISFLYTGFIGIIIGNFHKWINNGKEQQYDDYRAIDQQQNHIN